MENNIKIIKKCNGTKSSTEVFIAIFEILENHEEGVENNSNICKTK